MDWAALITWVLTAGGGFVLLAIWLKNGGMNQREHGRIRPAIILTHFALAATGLVLWIVYVASDRQTIAWIAFVLLLIVAAIGFAMLGIWLSQRRGRGGNLPSPQQANRPSSASRPRSSVCTACSPQQRSSSSSSRQSGSAVDAPRRRGRRVGNAPPSRRSPQPTSDERGRVRRPDARHQAGRRDDAPSDQRRTRRSRGCAHRQ